MSVNNLFSPNSFNIYANSISLNELNTNNLHVLGTSDSNSASTGALTVNGGVGVGGNIYLNGKLNVLDPLNTITSDSGALVVSGGVGVGKNLCVGLDLYANNGDIYANNINFTATTLEFISVGGGAIGDNLTVTFTKINSFFKMFSTHGYVNDQGANYGSIYTDNSVIPVEFRPVATDVYQPCTIISDGSNALGMIRFTTTGRIEWLYSFQENKLNGFGKMVVIYMI